MNEELVAHGGTLVDRLVEAETAERLRVESIDFASITLDLRQLCDLELLVNGGFSPLNGFMDARTYAGVVADMRLPDGVLWPMPVTLEVPAALADKLAVGSRIALRDTEGFMPAVLDVEDIFRPDRGEEAERVYGTRAREHPGVAQLLARGDSVCLGGTVHGVQRASHYDFEALRFTPAELRMHFARIGWRKVVAFHTSRPMHRLQRALCMEAARRAGAHLLIHPVVGMARPGDVSYYTRIKCYQAVQRHFPHGIAMLALLPLAMRMAGPREALWHAIVRRNFGCTHMIMANHHGSAPRGGESVDVHGPYAAQELVKAHAETIGIEVVDFEQHVYSSSARRFVPVSSAHAAASESYSTEQFDRALALDEPIPGWYTYREVIEVLRAARPPRRRAGFTLFFTGLSGAGKSTIAKIVYGKLIEDGTRPVTLLDGDVVRSNLSSELGFSRAHRDLNVRRIGFVAAEITKNRGVAICAPIAPYTSSRRAVREMVAEHGACIEIHVSTPLEVCESRDRKGLYAKARRGIIPEFTGVSDPYEVPERPELRIDTSDLSPLEAAEEVYLYLVREGYLDGSDDTTGPGATSAGA